MTVSSGSLPNSLNERRTETPAAADSLRVSPDFPTFCALAAKHNVLPVWCELVGDLHTPVGAFLRLRDDRSFLLESVERGEQWGRFSFVGCDPQFVLTAHDGDVEAEGDCPFSFRTGDPLRAVEDLLAQLSVPSDTDLPGLPPFYAGLVGYWGYETVQFMERVPVTNPRALDVPDMLLFATGTIVIFDHFRQRLLLVRNCYISDSVRDAGQEDAGLAGCYRDALAKLEGARIALAAPYGEFSPTPLISREVQEPAANVTPEAFMESVKKAKEYILAGDVFQVVVSRRYHCALQADPFDVHRALRLVNPSPYMTYLEHPSVTIVSGSPEELVRFDSGWILTRPIAGTRWRGATDEEDRELAADLLADPKERAEHVMLVDLARNDLGRLGKHGSVQVENFMTVERYSHVMHLVSTVVCEARPDVGPMDVLRATFPAGTVSGAPKVRAMEIIDELETDRRGPYAGVVGYVDFSGNLDTAIALRTAVVADGVVTVQAGGGIVADSDPAYELNESRNKARAVLVAVEAATRMWAAPEDPRKKDPKKKDIGKSG